MFHSQCSLSIGLAGLHPLTNETHVAMENKLQSTKLPTLGSRQLWL